VRAVGRVGGAVLAVAAAAVALLNGGGGSTATAALPAARSATTSTALSLAGLHVTPQLAVRADSLVGMGLEAAAPEVVSFDAYVPADSDLAVHMGSGRIAFGAKTSELGALVLSRGTGAFVSASVDGSTPVAVGTGGWLSKAGWRHVEISDGVVSVDGRRFSWSASRGTNALVLSGGRHGARLSAFITSPMSDAGALLFHRLAELHARVPSHHYPTGAALDDRLYYDPGWTSGFYAGALWEAAALEPAGGMFARWALSDTIEHFGMEQAPTHDVGFMYGQSSLRGYELLCGRGGSGSRSVCARLRSSVVSAADELVALAATNPVAGTIPTDPTSPEAETIVDSMMNIAILPWATAFTGNAKYSLLARHQATVVARVLVRKNGSTAQSANFDRASGRLISVTTHQGLSNTSTWARGESWTVYGFAVMASELHSRAFLRVAERVAAYVSSHLPAGGVPRWDYDAPAGAPVDASAGVITAAGLLHLVAACKQLDGASACTGPDARWNALAQRMLAAAVDGYASTRPPLGLLRSQIEDERWGGRCWCNHGELIYGLSYGLEGLALLGPR
jgi:hypothetical protein